MQSSRLLTGTAAAGLLVGSLFLAAPASGSPKAPSTGGSAGTVDLHAELHQLNRSGAHGEATATVTGTTIDRVSVTARGLAPDAPHAVHIHYGQQAAHECPTMGDATQRRADGTRRLNVADGVPSYGGIVVSLTSTGDTTPASALTLERMPVSQDGVLHDIRTQLSFTDVPGSGTAAEIAAAVRAGEGVVVVHGNDYNRNGRYDFDAAGATELPVAAPAEATDPTLCGVLERAHQ